MRELSGLERFLNCVSFHAFLFVILYKVLESTFSKKNFIFKSEIEIVVSTKKINFEII